MKKINVGYLFGSLASFAAAILIITGKTGLTIQPMNELFTFAVAFMLGVLCAIGIKKD